MMVVLWTRKRVMVDEEENNVKDISGHEKSAVQLA
jgi:hypothetical protein